MTDTSQAPDTRNRDTGTSSDRRATLTNTQAMTGASGGSAIVLLYVFACFHAKHIITPTIEQAIGILIIVGPFLHLIGRIVMYWTSRLLPKDAVPSLVVLAALSTMIGACTVDGRATTKPSQVDITVTAQKAQRDFQWACFALQGAHAAFNALQPVLKTSLDQTALNTEASAAAAITAVCAKPLDLSNVQGTVQQIMDAAGQVAAVIAKAKAPSP